MTTAIGGLAGGASTASAANFEAMKYANTEINFLMTGDENDHRALADLLPEMKAGRGKSEALRPNALRLGLIIPTSGDNRFQRAGDNRFQR